MSLDWIRRFPRGVRYLAGVVVAALVAFVGVRGITVLPVFPYVTYCWKLDVELGPHLSDEYLMWFTNALSRGTRKFNYLVWGDRVFTDYALWTGYDDVILNIQNKSWRLIVDPEIPVREREEPNSDIEWDMLFTPQETHRLDWRESLDTWLAAIRARDHSAMNRAECRLMELVVNRNPPNENRFE